MLDFRKQRLAWQTVGRDAVGHHAARQRHALEDRHLVTTLRQPQGCGEPTGSGPHHSHLDILGRRQLRRQPGHIEEVIGHETLRFTDGDRLVNVATPAALLAKSRAHAPTDQGKGIRVTVDSQGFGVAPLRDQGQVGRNVDAGRAGAYTAGTHEHLATGSRAAGFLDVREKLIFEVA